MKNVIKKKRFALLFLFVLIPVLIMAGQIKNPDRPEKGTHIFPLKQIWRVKGGGDILFGNIVTVVVSDSGPNPLASREWSSNFCRSVPFAVVKRVGLSTFQPAVFSHSRCAVSIASQAVLSSSAFSR